MTFGEACETLATRFGVDSESDFDVRDHNKLGSAINVAARRVSRETFYLFTWRADLYLVVDQAEYNTLVVAGREDQATSVTAVCSQPVFHVKEVHVNGMWLSKVEPACLMDVAPEYYNATSTANPTIWTPVASDIIRITAPPNATAVAASDNFVTGYREPDWYSYDAPSGNNKDAILQGPESMHDLIVDRAYLDNSKSLVQGSSGYARRQMIQTEYIARTARERDENLARFDQTVRRDGLGATRRYFGLGDY